MYLICEEYVPYLAHLGMLFPSAAAAGGGGGWKRQRRRNNTRRRRERAQTSISQAARPMAYCTTDAGGLGCAPGRFDGTSAQPQRHGRPHPRRTVKVLAAPRLH